jgi:hypothetical protein
VYDPEVNVDRSFTILDLAAKIDAGEPFAFSRWGDGEWRAVVSPTPTKGNCDGHAYFPDMGEALGNVLKSRPPYILGFQKWPEKIRRPWAMWLQENGLSDLRWVEANIFHFCAQAGDMTFREWPEILVGPKHLRPVFPNVTFIEVPSKNCWRASRETLDTLRMELHNRDSHTVVGYCASMAANVWLDRMYHAFPQHTHIDFGSAFDPLGGVYSRNWMRRAAKEGFFQCREASNA